MRLPPTAVRARPALRVVRGGVAAAGDADGRGVLGAGVTAPLRGRVGVVLFGGDAGPNGDGEGWRLRAPLVDGVRGGDDRVAVWAGGGWRADASRWGTPGRPAWADSFLWTGTP